jgi:magnesium chelatase subunit D
MLAPTGREPDPSERAWQQAVQAAVLFAIDPVGLGGVRVRAQAGPVRDAWLGLLRGLLPGRPQPRMPLSITQERLLGGLDLPATLAAGRPVAQRGLLAEADGGVLLLAMAERLSLGSAAQVAQTLDRQEVVLERDGLCVRNPARFGVVALDEGLADDDGVPAALCDRFAFDIDLRTVSPRVALNDDLQMMTSGSTDLDAARERLAAIELPTAMIDALCGAAQSLGVPSLRAPLLALAAARASAALDGNDVCSDDDARIAAALVLAPRATQWPSAQEATEEVQAEEPPTEPSADSLSESPPEFTPELATEASPPPDTAASATATQSMQERVLDAAQAAIPPGLLAALLAGAGPRRSAAGKSGAAATGGLRGRPMGSRRASALRGARLHLVDTLRAAAPWQRLRRTTLNDAAAAAPRVLVKAEDFHVARIRQKSATTTVFVVDASGSSALHRLAEAKGAVELLLNDCYVRRDQVAVIAFRGRQAELLLPPTRSLVCAKRRLSGLPGGGGTPLASALDSAAALVDALQRKGQSPTVVLLTDGRANVARDGSGGRERAQDDALQSGRLLAALGAPLLLIDTSPKAQREAAELARAMRANYLPLPYAGAAQLAQSVSAAQASLGAR